jgi:hypothetical protein
MKRFALLPALFALLLAAISTGAAFAQQAPPGSTLPQAGDMIPDASTISALAARSATAENMPQAGDMIPDASTIAAVAARSEARLQDPTLATPSRTAHFATSQYDSPGGLVTSAQATELGLPVLAAAEEMAAQNAHTTQLAPSYYDDSIEAPQVAAAMQAMAAVRVPSMEAIRLALVSQAPQAGQRVGGPVVLPAEATSQVAILAEAGSQMAILQATPAQNALTAQLAPSHYDDSLEARDAAAATRAMVAAQSAQTARLMPSHYDSLGAVTSAQARMLGLPALAGVKEMAEQKSQLARLQDPTLATPGTQASQDGQTTGGPVVLPTAADLQREEEAAESPAEVAFEEAEAAQAAGLSMSRVHSQGPETAVQTWALTLPALNVNACSNSLSIACTANGTRPALAVR